MTLHNKNMDSATSETPQPPTLGNVSTSSENTGAVCGGVISESYLNTHDPMGLMMSYVMPDKEFEAYQALKKAGNDKEAVKLFKQHAWSMI